MRGKSFYGRKKADGQTQTVVTNFGGGVDEYTPALSIGDNQLSSGLDYISENGISLKHREGIDATDKWTFGVNTKPLVTWNGTTSGVYPMTAEIGTPWYAWSLDNGTAGYSLVGQNFIAKPETTGAVAYITQAEKYSIYWSTDMNTLLVQAHSTRTITTVTLPTNVYPRDMVAHKARLFLIDTHNTLWWCNAGDYTTWYGETPTEEYVALDAGYWFVDSYDTINRICVFRDSLFVFGDNTIYNFTGYSDNSFALQRMFVGIGTYAYSYRSLTADSTYMYFTHKNKVYQYDGSSAMPMIISEPVISNGKYVNGISSGVKPWDMAYYTESSVLSVHVDENYLYWYPFYNIYTSPMSSGYLAQRVGMLDIKRRVWWKTSGFYIRFPTHYTGAHYYLFPAREASGSYWGVGCHSLESNTTTPFSRVRLLPTSGAVADTSASGAYTKLFAHRPSENMTLTDIYLVVYCNSYDSGGAIDVLVQETFEDDTYNDDPSDLDQFWFRSFQMYDLSNYNSSDSAVDLSRYFVTLHVPILPRMSTYIQDHSITGAQVTDGIFETYADFDSANHSATLMPNPYIKLRIKILGDETLEIHRMELKYRVKGASR